MELVIGHPEDGELRAMSDPYKVLDLPRHADEAEIRRRYLELVRQFPPDRAPERFAAIRAAYDEVRDPARRLEALLFETDTSDSFDTIAADLRARLSRARIPWNVLLALAEAS
jgi:curved DNA-binding protein CbpA